MGREVKRVPVDWDWPVGETWEGYLRPARLDGEPCVTCNGSGQSHFGWWLQNFCYRISMLAGDVHEQRRGRPMHPWLAEWEGRHGHFEDSPGDKLDLTTMSFRRYVVDRPGSDALEFFRGLMQRSHQITFEQGGEYAHLYSADRVPPAEQIGSSIGHSSNDTGQGNIQSALLTVLQDAAGQGLECQSCGGEGSFEKYEGQRAEAEAWERSEPPTGEGWQLWETVSEGSPISPVFPTAEALAQWLTTPAACWGAMRQPMTIEAARRFVGAGWAPSLIGSPSEGVMDGAEWVGTH